MTPEEAIKTLESMKDICRNLFPPKQQTALSQGIEALKFRQRWEDQEGEEDFPLMPGETKE